MEATLWRVQSDNKQTLGYLQGFEGIQKVFEAKTLELPNKRNQRQISRIPSGRYLCRKRQSAKYALHYEVLNVPNRSNILIHVLNYEYQTQGCIGVGKDFVDLDKDGDLDITSSRNTLNELLNIAGDEFYLTIIDLDY